LQTAICVCIICDWLVSFDSIAAKMHRYFIAGKCGWWRGYIIGTISEYLEGVTSENENVKDGLQQSTKTEG
jgi:hypothetical protein